MRRGFTATVLLYVLLSCHIPLPAQDEQPKLTSVFPFACQMGESIEVTLAGSKLDAATDLFFASEGIRAKHLAKNRFLISADGEVKTKDWDVWCVASRAMTNPRRFVVSRSPVIVEADQNDVADSAQQISIPCFVCARFEKAADIDWYRFTGQHGQRVTIECRSRTLDGQAELVVTIIDPDGNERAHSTGQRREPVVSLKLPMTGDYRVQIHERAYRKNDHSFYSLSLSDRPRLLAAYPSLLRRGETTQVTLYGFDLPGGKPVAAFQQKGITSLQHEITAPARADSDNGQWTESTGAVRQGFRFSLPDVDESVNFGLTRKAVIVETEPANDRIESAQKIVLPAHVNGRFLKKGDIDWFAFSAKKGQSLWIEGIGERIGHMMDLDISIHDASGKLITTLKDFAAPKGFPATFPLASLDCTQSWQVPADGDYRVIVRDLYAGSVAGLDRTYELSIRYPQPGFQLFARPTGTNGLTIPLGGKAIFEVLAVRQDGHNGDILIVPVELPAGLSVANTWIGPNAVTTLVSVAASPEFVADDGLFHQIQLKPAGGSKLEFQPIRSVSTIRTGTDARLTQGLYANVGAQALLDVSIQPESTIVPAGSLLRLLVDTKTIASERIAPIQVELKSLPTGAKAAKQDIAVGQNAGVIALTIPDKLPPGNYSVTASAKTKLTPKEPDKAASGKETPKPIDSRAWSNTVSFEVIKSPLSVTVKPKQIKLKRGESADVEVTIKRLDKSIEVVELKIRSSHGNSTIKAAPITIAKDQNSGTAKVTASAEAILGKLNAVAVEATMKVGDRNVVFRLPLDISITK